ncbi:hypothetical protein ACOMHN_045179 [Nucella lapillus]
MLAKLSGSCPKTFKCKSGKCTKDARGTVNGCHCDYDFYGPACDKPRCESPVTRRLHNENREPTYIVRNSKVV